MGVGGTWAMAGSRTAQRHAVRHVIKLRLGLCRNPDAAGRPAEGGDKCFLRIISTDHSRWTTSLVVIETISANPLCLGFSQPYGYSRECLKLGGSRQ